MKKNKAPYYSINALKYLIPKGIYNALLPGHLKQISQHPDKDYILERVSYYNKVENVFSLPDNATQIGQFKKTKGWTYFFDLYSIIKYFPKQLKFCYLNGDIRHIPEDPTFLKSRPISDDNANSVVLKLNKVRHFTFIKDTIPYSEKKDMAAWRGVGYQPHRQVVIKQFYNHPKCNIGQTKPKKGDVWEKGYMSIEEQLHYKFLLCIEGNDVATNLKWVMSSNSLCIMSKPKYETWFMEGRLQAGVHYVEVKDDYSDLTEKMDYYLEHEDEALQIIKNANDWVEQFKDTKREKLISLLVAKKYFEKSGQL